MKFKLDFILEATKGQLLNKKNDSFSMVNTDSRVNCENALFIPLKGENFDANDFIQSAIQNGCTGILTQKDFDFPTSVTVIKVNDTLSAMQDLAKKYRIKNKVKVIAITGSNGKTSTRNFTTQILSQKYRTHSSQKNYNNHIGLPISLLEIESKHEISVLELGMNHLHEIENLVQLCLPDICLVTNVGRGHLEGLGSIENVSKAKEEIYEFTPESIKIFNLDNEWTKKMYEKYKNKSKTITFSQYESKANVIFKEAVMTLDFLEFNGTIDGVAGRQRVKLFGRHHLYNLMAASALSLAAGMSPEKIWSSLAQVSGTWGRTQLLKLQNGGKLVFDGYNANPESMKALFESVNRLSHKGKKIFILAEMLELGEYREKCHRELGREAGLLGFDSVYFIGPSHIEFEKGLQESNFSKQVMTVPSLNDSFLNYITTEVDDSSLVVVKGSRGMQLEKIVEKLNPLDFKK